GALAAAAALALARLRQEEGLRAMLAAAELHIQSLEQAKGALLANVSHELRTPLVSIKGYTELVAKGRVGPLSDTQREYLSIALANVDRLVALIDNLLVYARMGQLGERLTRERLDLRRVIEEAIALLRPAAEAKGVRLTAELGESAVEVRGDRRRLAQVFANVLSNAVKFNRSGGSVTVRVVPAAAEAGAVTVTVTDTGIGIPAAAIPRVFERFYQVDQGHTRRYGGAGLGLSVVKELMRLHGGEVELSSTEGEGTTVVLRFPRPAPRRAAARRR
ncbi:MAG TPA: ATP-binding protein, partial [Thermodesulfobacteriota bacterium]|nr:ATP-binding protein [Thermodesulfobacteriota bacterium]